MKLLKSLWPGWVLLFLAAFWWLLPESRAAAPTILRADTDRLRQYDFDPMYVPSTEEDTFTRRVYLQEITLTNVTAGAVVVTIKDKNATPLNVVGPVTLAASTTYVIRFTARMCPGGVRWVADTPSAVVGYMRGLQ